MIIETLEITCEKTYKEYAEKAKPVLESFGAEYLAVSDNVLPISGNWEPEKILIIEFPDAETFHRCFKSEEYQQIKPLRENSVKSKVILVDSLRG